jgi:cbb3-type cytochrome oxidase subunit 3
MDTLKYIKPRLIEPGMKYFINSSLEQCHIIKTKYNNFLYNLGLLVFFILLVAAILYYKYSIKNNKKLQEEKKQQEQEYILNKLRFMQDYKKSQMDSMMSDLSNWQNNPEVQFFNRKIYT